MASPKLCLVVLLLCIAQCMSEAQSQSPQCREPPTLDVVQLATRVGALQCTVEALQRQLDAVTETVNRHVAFHVRIPPDNDNTVPAPASGPYMFGQVILNDGNGYDPVTGKFKAPYAGVYQFGLQLFLRGGQNINIDIKVNGRIVSRSSLETRGQPDQDDSVSTTVIVRLNAGDEVWVESGTGAHTLVSDVHTYFNGHLLY